jgi:sugar phosphate isomerase/epimerase
MWSIGFPGAEPLNPMTGDDLLDKALELGVSLVQTGPNLVFNTPKELISFFNRANSLELSLELGIRGLRTSHLIAWIQHCNAAGAKLLRTVPEIDGNPPSPDQIVDFLRPIRPTLEAAGVVLGLENGAIPCRDLRQAIDRLDSPNFGIVLDMVNSLAVPEGWKEVTSILAPYTVCLHYKDFSLRRAWYKMGFICEGRAAGQGQINTEWLFEALVTSQHDYNVILELWPPPQQNLQTTIAMEHEWAVESICYLRKFVSD